MTSQISEGVKISVETFYQPEYSNPTQSEYMFAYRITVENNNIFPVQLISRHWNIFDSDGSNREVIGDGVVGIKPIINTSKTYQYISGCNLKTEVGKMSGSYNFINVNNNKPFKVIIPAFQLLVPFKLN